jgi:hypothetical protein
MTKICPTLIEITQPITKHFSIMNFPKMFVDRRQEEILSMKKIFKGEGCMQHLPDTQYLWQTVILKLSISVYFDSQINFVHIFQCCLQFLQIDRFQFTIDLTVIDV